MTESSIRNRSSNGRRRGLASVAVLSVLFIVALIAAALLKVAFARRVELGMEERCVQAAWLAESGVDRAVARLASSGDYAGESWVIPAEELGGRGAGSVSIKVEKIADRPDRRKVRVEADYPVESSRRARQARELIVSVKSSSR